MAQITLAKALKIKNRLVGRLAKVQADIQAFNSIPEGQAGQVDVPALIQNREAAGRGHHRTEDGDQRRQPGGAAGHLHPGREEGHGRSSWPASVPGTARSRRSTHPPSRSTTSLP